MSQARVDTAEVRRIAELARLELSEEELVRMTRELGAILAYVQELEAVDTSGVEPLAHVGRQTLGVRADCEEPSLEPAVALAEAPRPLGGGFGVPAFVDEG
ncbi:MAG: Asp-tRNA(Asn)/Glu-tRNA(Gln) amidotransferase subunit GatC [Myxococcales bacterium]|nr:Asp-tRNA(Asn)/Glu-tRNA(Gln) amidotransferase subunit GatC [Myxococcales bacterium]